MSSAHLDNILPSDGDHGKLRAARDGCRGSNHSNYISVVTLLPSSVDTTNYVAVGFFYLKPVLPNRNCQNNNASNDNNNNKVVKNNHLLTSGFRFQDTQTNYVLQRILNKVET